MHSHFHLVQVKQFLTVAFNPELDLVAVDGACGHQFISVPAVLLTDDLAGLVHAEHLRRAPPLPASPNE